MPEYTRIELGPLNIVASPHPHGIYRRALAAVADKEVNLWGSDRAKITPFQPLEDRPNLLWGRILVGAEIDTEGKWLTRLRTKRLRPPKRGRWSTLYRQTWSRISGRSIISSSRMNMGWS